MGKPGYPLYGEDLGSAIERAEKVLDKIKTNKFVKEDLSELANELVVIADKIKAEIE